MVYYRKKEFPKMSILFRYSFPYRYFRYQCYIDNSEIDIIITPLLHAYIDEDEHVCQTANSFFVFLFSIFFFGGVGQTAFAKSAITRHVIIIHTSGSSRSTHIQLLFSTMYHTCLIDQTRRCYELKLSFFGACIHQNALYLVRESE